MDGSRHSDAGLDIEPGALAMLIFVLSSFDPLSLKTGSGGCIRCGSALS